MAELMNDADDAASPLVEGRSCGDCHLCCKVFPIEETGKSDDGWCPHLDPARGCAIHADRPGPCREFFCLWRYDASLGDDWKPCNAGFVLHDPAPFALFITEDVDNPGAWRRDPYEGDFRSFARDLISKQYFVGYRRGERTMLLLKDGEIELK